MSRTERDKGRKGEAEVAAIYTAAGLAVRGLEGSGDHLIVCGPSAWPMLHSEVKRQETARPWAWFEQAQAEAPAGATPVVAFRRNRSPWLALLPLEELAAIVGQAVGVRPMSAYKGRAESCPLCCIEWVDLAPVLVCPNCGNQTVQMPLDAARARGGMPPC